MGTSNDRKNLLDIAKMKDPDGAIAQVAEVLDETNAILQDMPMEPSNGDFGHRVTLRSSLPNVGLVRINQGTPKSKGSYEQRVDTMGIFAGLSEVDTKVRKTIGADRFAQVRQRDDLGFAEAMSQSMALSLCYGDEAANEADFTGLVTRLATLNALFVSPQSRVISAGGVGADNASILVVDWHPRYVHGIYPAGYTGGVEVTNLGDQRVEDADGNPFMAAVTQIECGIGVTVEDARHLGRLCNIDVSDIATSGESDYAGPNLLLKLQTLLAAMPPPGGAQRVMYTPAVVWDALEKQAQNKSNVLLSLAEYMGKGLTPHFRGWPIRRVDQMSTSEALVS